MGLIVLTSDRFTTASRCLPALCQSPRLQVVGVVLAHAVTPDRRRRWRRKVRKVLRIGPLGALNGIRIRPWYQDKGAEPQLTSIVESPCYGTKIEQFPVIPRVRPRAPRPRFSWSGKRSSQDRSL